MGGIIGTLEGLQAGMGFLAFTHVPDKLSLGNSVLFVIRAA